MRRMHARTLILTALASLGLAFSAVTPATAQASVATTTTPFVSFNTFINETAASTYATYAVRDTAATRPTEPAFNQMRSYILNLYQGVEVVHSYSSDSGYFDCVTENTQPSVRDLAIHHIATPPAPSGNARAAKAQATVTGTLLGRGLHDAYGNAIACPTGTIPMRRLTLDQMTKFPTVAAYMAKGPSSVEGTVPSSQPLDVGAGHRYAYGLQSILNYGGNSFINDWNPSATFSLSQQWNVNGSGSGTQTAEGGWIMYPAHFEFQSVLFIYYTPNDYTSGCYNLECSGFVQTSNAVGLGSSFVDYSIQGGQQYGFQMQYKYYNGNWWMFMNSTAIGYYPASVYGSGPMSQNSDLIEYGGETYSPDDDWGEMGSGDWADGGYTHAAFQNSIFYIPSNENGGTNGVYATLTPEQPDPACYTFLYIPAQAGGSNGTSFYFGGPGSDDC